MVKNRKRLAEFSEEKGQEYREEHDALLRITLHHRRRTTGMSRCDEYTQCDECNITLQYDIVQVLVTSYNSCFSIRWTYNVGTSLLQFSEGYDAHCTTNTSRYIQVRTVNLSIQTMRQVRFAMRNVIPHLDEPRR
jgi:hypothetical protein